MIFHNYYNDGVPIGWESDPRVSLLKMVDFLLFVTVIRQIGKLILVMTNHTALIIVEQHNSQKTFTPSQNCIYCLGVSYVKGWRGDGE